MKKTVCIVFVILFVASLMTGCFNYEEVNEMSIVSGVSVDKDPQTGKYILNVETVMPPSTGKGNPESKIVETQGETIFDAVRNSIMLSGKRNYWAHTQILIIGEEAACQGITDILDWFLRDAELRLFMHVLIAKGASAKEMLSLEGVTSSIHSLDISTKINNSYGLSKYPEIELVQVCNLLSSESSGLYLPVISKNENNNKDISKVGGTAVFKKDKLIGFLDEDESKYFNFIINQVKGGLVPIPYIGSTHASLTLEILSNRTKVTPQIQDSKPSIKLFIPTEAVLAENGSSVNYAEAANLDIVTKEAQSNMTSNVKKLIKEVQQKFNSDIFGFGATFARDMPDAWSSMKFDWDKIFPTLEVEVESKFYLKNRGNITQTIGDGK